MTKVCGTVKASGDMRMITLIVSEQVDDNTLNSDLRQFLIPSYVQCFLIATM
jgi:hypothetical protein